MSHAQTGPITTSASPLGPDPWNDSRTTHALWTSTNVGEAVPDVLTPASWSLVERVLSVAMATWAVPPYVGYGRIGGRVYLNLTVVYGLTRALGVSQRRVRALTEDIFGQVPDWIPVPPLRGSRFRILAGILPVAVKVMRRTRGDSKRLGAYLSTHPRLCEQLRATIARIDEPADLARLWRGEISAGLDQASRMLSAATRSGGSSLVTTPRRLRALVGESDANAILTGAGGSGGDLASLELMRGLEELGAARIDRDEFNQVYGHRGPHELEISIRRPGEDPTWLAAQVAQRDSDPGAYRTLLERQEAVRAAAWARVRSQHPHRAARLARETVQWNRMASNRESARSEVVRFFWVLRAYVQRAGELTGLGDDIYFLDADQIAAVLDGEPPDRAAITAARRAYNAYNSLPVYPPLILGSFDPYAWASDPHRRGDVAAEGLDLPARDTIRGFPGAAGQVEGIVRIMTDPANGAELRAGEVLVSPVTNVGWTPLFPRVAAIITDVGAPLSHAAIVARELGIPAVVGCGDATTRLRTGDRVRVDGSAGVVVRLPESAR